jgi:integrase
MKANANLYLDSRQKKDGFCSVKIKITFDRKRRYYNTDVSLYYPEELQTGKDPDPLTKLLTAERRTAEQKAILKKLNVYLDKADKLTEALTPFTFERFEEAYFENRDLKNSVSYAFDRKIEKLRLNEQIGTAVSYECAKNSLLKYKESTLKKAGNKKLDLTFSEITPEFLTRYEKKMIKDGNSITTVGIYLRNLRTLFNKQTIDKDFYPFGKDKYEIPTGQNIKKALTLDEIARIYNYETKPLSFEDRAKDYWLFMYLCNGMNVKDFCLLKWSNIDGNILTYERAKTQRTERVKKPITVSLKPEAMEIIKKWGQPAINKEAFIFPHLSNKMTVERQREVYQQLTKNTNKHIKRIAKAVGIEKHVTTYSARHSFATVLKRSGANISMISDLLGHSSLSVTENYLAGFELDQIQKQTDVLTAGFHKKVN